MTCNRVDLLWNISASKLSLKNLIYSPLELCILPFYRHYLVGLSGWFSPMCEISHWGLICLRNTILGWFGEKIQLSINWHISSHLIGRFIQASLNQATQWSTQSTMHVSHFFFWPLFQGLEVYSFAMPYYIDKHQWLLLHVVNGLSTVCTKMEFTMWAEWGPMLTRENSLPLCLQSASCNVIHGS